MGNRTNRIKNYISAKGKMHKMSNSDIYYKCVELRTVLCDIAREHKKWGREWYNFVEISFFNQAQYALISHAKGDMVVETVAKIKELEDLETELKHREEGDK